MDEEQSHRLNTWQVLNLLDLKEIPAIVLPRTPTIIEKFLNKPDIPNITR